jgi:hypothetical protein
MMGVNDPGKSPMRIPFERAHPLAVGLADVAQGGHGRADRSCGDVNGHGLPELALPVD